jgi:hypothetical protein
MTGAGRAATFTAWAAFGYGSYCAVRYAFVLAAGWL